MIDVRFIAGFFQGEGCFHASFKPELPGSSYTYASITQVDPTVLLEVQKRWGGRVHKKTGPSIVKLNRKDQWVWCVKNRKEMLKFLSDIEPHMFGAKRKVVQAGIEYVKTISAVNTGKRTPSKVFARRRSLYGKIKKLNHRGRETVGF